jgi:hypothetical protein
MVATTEAWKAIFFEFYVHIVADYNFTAHSAQNLPQFYGATKKRALWALFSSLLLIEDLRGFSPAHGRSTLRGTFCIS